MLRDPSLYNLPPSSLEAEESILSGCLLFPDVLQEVLENITNPDVFYKTSHQIIYSGMLSLWGKGNNIDLVTLQEELKKTNQLEEIGGATYLARMVDTIPVPGNIKQYCKIINGKAVMRNLITSCNSIIGECFDSSVPAEDILDKAQKELLSVDLKTDREIEPLANIVEGAIDRLGDLYKLGGASVTGVSTGFKFLDNMTAGFQNSDLITIAARPGAGKSGLAFNIAQNVAHNDEPVLIFSYEMSKNQLINRLLSRGALVNSGKFRNGKLEASDWQNVIEYASQLSESKMFIEDDSDLTIMEMRRIARKYKKEHGIVLVIIDYLQLIPSDKSRKGNREEEVSNLTRNLKAMAKELDLPVVELAQLNRDLEKRSDKRPILADLRESGAVEQDSDIVIFIYRDEMYNTDENNPKKGTAEIIFAKNRHGITGTKYVGWEGAYTQFFDFVRSGE